METAAEPAGAPALRNEITEGNLWKALLSIALPVMVANLLQAVVEVVDLYFVGRLGPDAIAGVALATTLIFFLVTVLIGIATATAAFISRAYGAGDRRQVGSLLYHALLLGLAFSLVLMVIGAFFAPAVLALMGATGAVAADGAAFLSTFLLGIGSLVMLWLLIVAFQSTGDARTPMYVMVVVILVNILANPVLIFGLGAVPAFGVAGSALATVLARTVGLAILGGIVLLGKSVITLPENFRPDPALFARIVTVAIPSALQNGMRSFSYLAIMAIVTGFGAAVISAYGIIYRVEYIALMPGFAFATATAVMVGQNLGARQPGRAEQAVRYSLVCYGAVMAGVSAACILAAPAIFGFFDPSGTSTPAGQAYFAVVAPLYVLNAVSLILSFAMNGAGATRIPMVATFLALIATQLPLAVVLSSRAGLGLTGVFYAVAIAIVVQVVILALLYRRGTWKAVRL
jgi:putative MATE family efflux protein